MNRRIVSALLVALVTAISSLAAQEQERSFPNTKQQGRAITEYKDRQVHMVAAYEYSQRNHASAWILIQLAVSTTSRTAIHRDNIELITPDGRVVPVASQQQFLADADQLTRLVQNAQIWQRPLGSYFNTRPQPTIRFFSFPGRIVHDSAVSNLDEVASGELFFKSPTLRWEAGTYALVLDHPEAKAEVPIRLE